MNRRDFLRLMLASASATFVDYEKLLWIPGEKTIVTLTEPVFSHLDVLKFYYGGKANYFLFKDASR